MAREKRQKKEYSRQETEGVGDQGIRESGCGGSDHQDVRESGRTARSGLEVIGPAFPDSPVSRYPSS